MLLFKSKSIPNENAIPNPNGRALVSLEGEGTAPLLLRATNSLDRKTRRSRFLDLAANETEKSHSHHGSVSE
jgi:hypothetical protein